MEGGGDLRGGIVTYLCLMLSIIKYIASNAPHWASSSHTPIRISDWVIAKKVAQYVTFNTLSNPTNCSPKGAIYRVKIAPFNKSLLPSAISAP